ncbi:hypothetical protein FALBO_10877 [Fusarium albosuccineum]|uniref:Uncharacterized protein n=1 Tax=Fusarium albosuccineum TaxID=1237068 RepID=A0A8H4P4M8_9HYPO|nr:hypothetical protein FALBO_10877 [Fusarium albosuccineum]
MVSQVLNIVTDNTPKEDEHQDANNQNQPETSSQALKAQKSQVCTVPQPTSNMPYPQHRNSFSSRSYNRQQGTHRSQHRGSRAFDCCSPPRSESRRENNNRFSHSNRASHSPEPRFTPSTYGTWILPLQSQQGQYQTMDPTKCRCNCCPHPSSISPDHDGRRSPAASDMSHSYSSNQRSTHHRSSAPKSARDPRHPPERYVINVVDRSNGPLRHEYGRRYPISISPDSTCAAIASFLAPDKRRAKVIVHWKDGQTESLDNEVPMKEVMRDADHLEVKDRKRVHWE